MKRTRTCPDWLPSRICGQGTAMKRDVALHILQIALPDLKERFNVEALWIFGSVARDEARADSDLDVLVCFVGPATFNGFMDRSFELEEQLGVKVDLATPNMLQTRIRPAIERDLIRVPEPDSEKSMKGKGSGS